MLAPVLRSQFTTQEVCYAAARVVNYAHRVLRYRAVECFFKNWPFQSTCFQYFRLFNTVDSKPMININFADDWI